MQLPCEEEGALLISSETPRQGKIYDAVHGFIRFNPIEQLLIDSLPFQRLHHLHQLGIAYLVYPGATHTRFEHSLGAMELATRIFERITAKGFSPPDSAYWLQILRLAALCHDLGHLPFCHDAEKGLLGQAGHESWTYAVIQSAHLKPVWELVDIPGRSSAEDVSKMAIGEKKLLEMGISLPFSPLERVLSQVITGDFFGADRIDYLLRDAQCTGVSYGLFDYHQLIEMLRVLPVNSQLELGIEENGIESCEALLLARHFMHQRVYQYGSVKAHKFHLSRFMQAFYAEGNYLENLESYLSVTDNEILSALRKAAKDPSAVGHKDAVALFSREKRCRAIPISGEEIPQEIAGENYVLEPASKKGSKNPLSFFVLTRSGQVLPAQECSQIAIPDKNMSWVYLL